MILRAKGIIEFSPEDITNRHKEQSSWKHVALIRTNCDIDRYYAWFLKKRFNLVLNKNLRGTHITFISDKMDKKIFDDAAKMFNGREIEFLYDTEPRSNGEHWWLRAWSRDAENIRMSMGLDRNPYYDFHITIGHANEKVIEFSEYITRQCKRFELISNSTRISTDEAFRQVS